MIINKIHDITKPDLHSNIFQSYERWYVMPKDGCYFWYYLLDSNNSVSISAKKMKDKDITVLEVKYNLNSRNSLEGKYLHSSIFVNNNNENESIKILMKAVNQVVNYINVIN